MEKFFDFGRCVGCMTPGSADFWMGVDGLDGYMCRYCLRGMVEGEGVGVERYFREVGEREVSLDAWKQG